MDIDKIKSKENSIQLEQELAQTKQRLKLTEKAGNIGSFEWNILRNNYILSPELEALYGLAPGGFSKLKSNWAQAIHPDDREEAKNAVDTAIKKGVGLNNEFRVIWPDGSVHWLQSRSDVVVDETGKVVKMFGVNVDITKLKEAEQKLKTESSRFKTLIEKSSGGLLLLNSHGEVKTIGNTVLGYSNDDWLGRNIIEAIHPEHQHGVMKKLQNLYLKKMTQPFMNLLWTQRIL